MFYYAEIDGNYLVINTHSLTEPSTNGNYISITEEQYTNGNLVGEYYNSLTGNFEKIHIYIDYIGDSDWVTYDGTEMLLTTKVDNMQVEMNEKADINHTHTEYASSDDLALLEDVIGSKADTIHTHSEYASTNHGHIDYVTQTAFDVLSEEVGEKANSVHTHSYYASISHTHTASEVGAATSGHNHDSDYADISHNHDSEYASIGHDHDSDYATVSHSHTNYATVASLNEVSDAVSSKANTSHTHDDRYFTETEINSMLATKADSTHTHTDVYDVNGAAASALTSANAYTDEAIDSLNETVATKADASTVSSHTGNTAVHITSAERSKLSGVAEGANNYVLPSAGTSLGGVKTGGDVTISSGVITVNDDSHNHVISNVDGLQSALDGKAASGHNHDGVYYTETEVDTLLEGKANTSHTHTISNITNLQSTLDGKANTSHGTHVSYSTTAPVMDGTATVGTATTVARSDHKHPTDTSRAAQTSLDSHTSNKSNPHGVTLAQLGLTATAAELNILDGITATTAELNYVDGVTSNIQTQLNGKAASSHTHNYAGSSSAGGAATSANKLATARTISLTGDVTGSTSFDGSGNVSITATVADDSHNHTIANIDGLQSALDGKSATSHNHNSAYISKDLQMTSDNGDVSISWSGKDVVAQFKTLASGMYTVYSPAGCTNNPNSSESFRFMIHKTGSANYGWVMAYGAKGSVYTGYIDNGNWQGWKAIYENSPSPLWTGASYMTDVHTITPSKTLTQCRNGWVLLWSDYDPGSGANNTDFYASVIYKRAYTGQSWNGGEWYCDVPSYSAGTATDSEQRVIKLLKIYDNKIVGTVNNSAAPRNDVVLRAVYEW